MNSTSNPGSRISSNIRMTSSSWQTAKHRISANLTLYAPGRVGPRRVTRVYSASCDMVGTSLAASADPQEQTVSMSRRTIGLAIMTITVSVAGTSPAAAAELPPGFLETLVTSELVDPTAMAFAPDGRLFVCQQAGQLRIVDH